MGPKIDSSRPQVFRAPERKEAPIAAAAPQPKTLGPTRPQPTDGFVPPASLEGRQAPAGTTRAGKAAPASLTLDPQRLERFKSLSSNMVSTAVFQDLKANEARKTFEAGFILAGATKKEAKFLTRTLAMQEYRAAKAGGSGGLTVEKYGLAREAVDFLEKDVNDKWELIKNLNLGQIQSFASDAANKAPVEPAQKELARDFYLFTVAKRLVGEGIDLGKAAKPASGLDSTTVDPGEWRKRLQLWP